MDEKTGTIRPLAEGEALRVAPKIRSRRRGEVIINQYEKEFLDKCPPKWRFKMLGYMRTHPLSDATELREILSKLSSDLISKAEAKRKRRAEKALLNKEAKG